MLDADLDDDGGASLIADIARTGTLQLGDGPVSGRGSGDPERNPTADERRKRTSVPIVPPAPDGYYSRAGARAAADRERINAAEWARYRELFPEKTNG